MAHERARAVTQQARGHLDDATDRGERAAKDVNRSPAYRALVSVGLVCYGLVHLLVAGLGIGLASGHQGPEQADQKGALALLAEAPLGRVMLLVVAVGFAVLVVWQAIEAAIGYREFDGAKRVMKRISSAGRAVVYGGLSFASARIAFGAGQGGDSQKTLSARLMAMPGGQVLVGLVGAGIIAFGVSQVVRGLRGTFNEDLERDLTGTGRWIAAAGFCAKGIAYLVVGVLFVVAAVRYDPDRAGGLDEALAEVLRQPWGSPLLVAMSIGIGLYGLFCFYWARHPRRD